MILGAALSAAKILILGIKYDPWAAIDRNKVMEKFANDSALNRSAISREIRQQGFPNLRGVAFRRHGIFDSFNSGRSFVLASNVNMVAGNEYNTDILAHELRHIAQQEALTFGAVEFYSRYTWQYITKRQFFYLDVAENTTFEVRIAP
jgi:hypothetical protein